MYNPKSSSVAGVLGIVLGAFGAHDWYLGNRDKQAKRHLLLTLAGVALYIAVIIIRMIASSGQSPEVVTLMNNIASVLYALAWMIILGSFVWGVVDGVLILVQGDAGLKARGYYIENDPDNPLSRALSTTTVREGRQVDPHHIPTPVQTRPAAAAPRPSVKLPSTPTLEQQGSNVRPAAQPIVFRSSDIHQTFQFSNIFDDAENATKGQVIALPNPISPPIETPTPLPAQPQADPSASQPVSNANQPLPVANQPIPVTNQSASAPGQSVPTVNQPAVQSSLNLAQPVSGQVPTQPLPSQSSAPAQPAYRHPALGHLSATEAVGTNTIKDVGAKVKRKFTFNPVVTRRIIISLSALFIVVVAGFVIKDVLESTVTSGYQSAYRAAKSLSPLLAAASQTPHCQYVTDYLDDTTVTTATYDTYINGCRETLTNLDPAIAQLAAAPAIGWDSNLSASFQDFKQLYDETLPSPEAAATQVDSLGLYQAWHAYLIAASQLGADSPDAAATQAADLLKNSGNEVLSTYATDWLARELDYLAASRRFAETVPGPEYEALRREAEQKRNELQAWAAEHAPDLVVITPVASLNLQPLLRSFNSLYERIKRAYAQNYDPKSGDCDDRSGTVYCD